MPSWGCSIAAITPLPCGSALGGTLPPHDAVHASLGVAPAGAKIQPAVGTHRDVGGVDERLGPSRNTSAVALYITHMRFRAGTARSVRRPVANEQSRCDIASGTSRDEISFHARRRAAQLNARRQAVDKIVATGPAAAPAKFGPGTHVVQSRWPIPGACPESHSMSESQVNSSPSWLNVRS